MSEIEITEIRPGAYVFTESSSRPKGDNMSRPPRPPNPGINTKDKLISVLEENNYMLRQQLAAAQQQIMAQQQHAGSIVQLLGAMVTQYEQVTERSASIDRSLVEMADRGDFLDVSFTRDPVGNLNVTVHVREVSDDGDDAGGPEPEQADSAEDED